VNHLLDPFRAESSPVEHEGHNLNRGGILPIDVPRAKLVGKKNPPMPTKPSREMPPQMIRNH
jgi:hypothetical protein